LRTYNDSKLVFDKKVRKIARGAYAGTGMKNPKQVVVLGNLKQISYAAFADSNIQSFEVYGDIERIDAIAFRTCSLKKFICHGSVKQIGACAFYNNAYLEKLSLGKNIESIGKYAFKYCWKIKKPHVKKK
jgi:hypothetical protein